MKTVKENLFGKLIFHQETMRIEFKKKNIIISTKSGDTDKICRKLRNMKDMS